MESWFLHAVGAAVFAALVTILAKIGVRNVDSHLATAIRTVVVLVFAWGMVFFVGSQSGVFHADVRTWVFLILSGLATGASWLCYLRALQIGNVNRVVPVAKNSTILTMILAFAFLREPIGIFTVSGMVLMAFGTWLMIEIKKSDGESNRNLSWLLFAVLTAVFASLTAILARVGFENIEANLGTAIRTVAVLPMSLLMVFLTGGQKGITKIDKKSWLFLVLSGMATGASWLLFFRALQLGNASQVVPIDKLSIVLTMGFARFFLGERFSRRSLAGLALLVSGTLLATIGPVL